MLRKYLHYFSQSIRNRGWIFTFKLLWHEWRDEQYYGINTLQIADIKHLHLDDNHHYQGASYFVLNQILSQLSIEGQKTVFIDFGAGKGRALVVGANKHFAHVIGVELSDELCQVAQQNIAKVQHRYPRTQFEVVHADATTYNIPNNANVLFFFNPFGALVMQQVINNIKQSIQHYPRLVYVVYVNPIFGHLFETAQFKACYQLRSKNYLEATIFSNI